MPDKENINVFGEFIKKMRLRLGKSLRSFCLTNGLDPANVSRIERGMAPPPQSQDKLEEYARFLGINKNTDDWYDFFNYAAISVGRVPSYIMTDAELVEKLPFVFRAFREKPLSEDELKKFAEDLRRA